jgi:hypothetical protein
MQGNLAQTRHPLCDMGHSSSYRGSGTTLKTMRVVALLTTVALLGIAAAPASAATRSARSGDVQAQISYEKRSDFGYRDVRITITRGDLIMRDEPAPCSEAPPDADCLAYPPWPVINGGHNPVRLVSIDTDPESEVIIELFTGGAHCCSLTPIYDYDPLANSYRRVVANWADPGFRLTDLGRDGRREFVSADPRFAYEFASFAGSAFPIQIWRFRDSRLVNVTRSFKREIARDAARHRREYIRVRRQRDVELRGILAAYVADKYLLGQKKSAIKYLRRAKHRGDLGKGGEAFISKLRRFLKARGY